MSPQVRISDYLTTEHICAKVVAQDKETLFHVIAQSLADQASQHSAQDIYTVLMEREALGSTGIEGGVALPHGRLRELKHPIMAFASTQKPISFDAIDESLPDLFFVLLAPQSATSEHLMILATLSKLLHGAPNFTNQLRQLNSATDILNYIHSCEDALSC